MSHQLLIDRYRAARADRSLAVLEGLHPIKHALRFGASLVEAVCADPVKLAELAAGYAPDVSAALLEKTATAPLEVFGKLSPVSIPTGVIAIANRPEISLAALLTDPSPAPVIFLEQPRNLGNIGAVVRVAAAAGAAGVITTGAQDPWSPAALVGGAGLQYALPVCRAEGLPRNERPLVAVDPEGRPLPLAEIPPRSILAFGSERTGLSRELKSSADACVSIPMAEGVSSLNLATAVAVALYTWKFQGKLDLTGDRNASPPLASE